MQRYCHQEQLEYIHPPCSFSTRSRNTNSVNRNPTSFISNILNLTDNDAVTAYIIS